MKKNNIISDWLDQYGNPEIDKFVETQLNQNKMGILKDKVNSLKKDPWYKKLRRWVKFKLWLLKHELNKSE